MTDTRRGRYSRRPLSRRVVEPRQMDFRLGITVRLEELLFDLLKGSLFPLVPDHDFQVSR
jgi:hypothetical protein